MNPLMSPREIRIVKKALLNAQENNPVVRVLEWGSGGSTVYFTRFLKQRNIPYLWRSVEYNEGWYEKVLEELRGDTCTTLKLFDVGNNVLRQRYVEMEDYILYPSTLNEQFDVIIVDGRKRRRCVLEAKKLLAPKGVVFLHDAQRKHYQCSFKEFSDQGMLGAHIWYGTNTDTIAVQKVWNKTRTVFFLLLYKIIIKPWQCITSHLKVKYDLTRGLLLQTKSVSSKLKILIFIFLLALKKRKIVLFDVSMNITIQSLEHPKRVTLSSYVDAAELHRDIVVFS